MNYNLYFYYCMLCNAISFTLTLPGNGYGYEYKMCELIKTILISESLESK